MAEVKWIDVVKKHVAAIKKEGKLEGKAIMKEAIKRASAEWKESKKSA